MAGGASLPAVQTATSQSFSSFLRAASKPVILPEIPPILLLTYPVPDHLIEQLTQKDNAVDEYRSSLSIDSETLPEYCAALTIALLNHQDLPVQREYMVGILYEMVFVLSEDLKAPRFVRGSGGLKMIDGEALPGVH